MRTAQILVVCHIHPSIVTRLARDDVVNLLAQPVAARDCAYDALRLTLEPLGVSVPCGVVSTLGSGATLTVVLPGGLLWRRNAGGSEGFGLVGNGGTYVLVRGACRWRRLSFSLQRTVRTVRTVLPGSVPNTRTLGIHAGSRVRRVRAVRCVDWKLVAQ